MRAHPGDGPEFEEDNHARNRRCNGEGMRQRIGHQIGQRMARGRPAPSSRRRLSRRNQGEPRPLMAPSSESASAKAILIPAPIEAARPTRNVDQLLCVAKAAAKSGASVETEPSINPARPGWMYCRTKFALLPRIFLLALGGIFRYSP